MAECIYCNKTLDEDNWSSHCPFCCDIAKEVDKLRRELNASQRRVRELEIRDIEVVK